ncbi:carbohydrate ABC transporter permease [Cryptosporangium aurantiacum]|uniref:N,N'-diacetylchitobiose transport system permease protein n=1 Tax=Cryptosporangium aurantiacum TaxID=134849 RepID=A0A1M7JGG8_9ACTN|nr:sugar ABC transporter permease [Cryptosporangium aurantiacum]SHM52170.1 N,N'-diacetylchitobiose transport system permease protein [Cryptosporangium aurantiacum]
MSVPTPTVSRPAPDGADVAPPSEPPAAKGRREPLPYILIVPSMVALVALFGYPVFLLFRMSFQQLGFGELVRRVTIWTGVDNYTELLGDPEFWQVVGRTVAFTAVCVTLTMTLGTGIGLLLVRLGKKMRIAVSISLVVAWAVPIVTATTLFQWLFDVNYGVVNWVLGTPNHDWFATGISTFGVIVTVIVWQAVPFVAFTVQAGVLSIPEEYYEAARMDGAGPVRAFRTITLPILRSILAVLAFLSTIWDFKVFTQVWAIRQGGPDGATTTLPIYLYDVGIASSRYGLAAAGAVVMVLILAVGMVFYLRHMLKTELDS